MMMNYSKRVVGLIILLGWVASCDVEQELFSDLRQETVLTSDDPDVIAVLAASAYSPIVGTWGGHNSLWSLHEISSDEMAITQKGADWEDGGQWIRVHRHQYLPTEEAVLNGWNYCYSAIGTVNNLLVTFGENEFVKAELEALRALIYWWLLDAYGNVPIITEETTSSSPPTNTRQEVFNFVESSLVNNLDLLSTDLTFGRVNFYVAQTILAKLYLNAEVYTGTPRWQDAVDACQEVIDGGLYSLEPVFFSNFATRNNGSMENIFVLNYDEDNAQGFNLGQMTLHYASQQTYGLQEQPWNGYSSLEDFYNSFDENDVRINSFLEGQQFALDGSILIDDSAEPADPDGPPVNFTPFITELTPNALRQEGVRVGKFEFAIGAGANLSNSFPIFRYADVLLMKAEALWRMNNGDTEALALVNEIRSRANMPGFDNLTAARLLAERGREFFAEGHRRTDLIRFGRFNDAWWGKPNASSTTKNIFPIPDFQIQVNTNLQQNDGY